MHSEPIELAVVREIIRSVNYPNEVVGIARLHGGSTDTYRIDFADGAPALVLKIYADEPQWAMKKEALVAEWIGDRIGIAIPRWIASDESRRFLPQRFAIMTLLPGVPVRSLIGAPDVDVAYRQMGALLKRLHGISMKAYGYIVGDGIRQPMSDNSEYMGSAFERAFRQFRELGGDTGLMQRLESEVAQRFEVLAYSVGAVLCHNDLQQGNVLAARDTGAGGLRLTGLIDFANAGAGEPLMDLALALFCCTHEDPRSREPLLAGYGQIQHPESETALWLYMLYHRVVMWTHLKRLSTQGRADDPVGLLQDLSEMRLRLAASWGRE